MLTHLPSSSQTRAGLLPLFFKMLLEKLFYDSGSTTTPFITISVKLGTDSGGPGTVGLGTPVQKSFNFHKDV